MFWIGLLVGAIIGGVIGMFATALCTASGRGIKNGDN